MGTRDIRDSQGLVAACAPRKTFGPSAFGPLRFHAVDATGSKGDWQPLATLVRVPMLKEMHNPSPDKQCQLSGSDLV
jgi:hypothetical protein